MAFIRMSLDDVQKLLARLEFVRECVRLDYPADALDATEIIKESLLQAIRRFPCSSSTAPELLN
jgi:L-ribulose-5-phosphate 3-epimerase UlaE